ncbi:MAG: DctP family TRAP transporter solute-binding subunit [Actinophytocola sp.]|nr:DctP family TRAP transporter solute-binding subunit [Actinophytocola sp.]
MPRNRSNRTVLGTAILLSVALVAAACGGARSGGGGGEDGSYTIKFSHVVTADTPKGQAAEKFKELVEKNCGDQVTVEVYPNSELYGDEDEMQALQSGAVQMLAPASAKFTTIAPQLQVLDLPFLFDSVEDIPEVASPDTAVGQAIYENDALAKRGIKVLGLWDNGLKQLSSNQPMEKPADLKGLRFRIQPSDVLRSQFSQWNAETTPMAFAEVYNALQQGVIDGQENPYSNIESQNMHTVQKHITESNHGYIGYVHTINNEFYQSLPPELQECVTNASDKAAAFNREIAADLNEEAKQAIRDEGSTQITELSDEQRRVFKDAVVPRVWQQYADVIGQDLVNELLKNQR